LRAQATACQAAWEDKTWRQRAQQSENRLFRLALARTLAALASDCKQNLAVIMGQSLASIAMPAFFLRVRASLPSLGGGD
jgi:hypothetical protein